MSAINEAVEAVIGMMNGLGLFCTVTRGALPTGAGITCEVGPSTPSAVYMDKGMYILLDLVLNGKHGDLKTLSEAMNEIHSVLTRARAYPSGEGWQVVDIANYTLPERIGRESDNSWLMASALSVRLSWEGDD